MIEAKFFGVSFGLGFGGGLSYLVFSRLDGTGIIVVAAVLAMMIFGTILVLSYRASNHMARKAAEPPPLTAAPIIIQQPALSSPAEMPNSYGRPLGMTQPATHEASGQWTVL